jgi:hypothetical protein
VGKNSTATFLHGWDLLHEFVYTDATVVQLFRDFGDDDIPFDMEIDVEEAAWEIIPLDIVKDDVNTEQQYEILKSRETRTYLEDRDIKKRRMIKIIKPLFHHKVRMETRKNLIPLMTGLNLLSKTLLR